MVARIVRHDLYTVKSINKTGHPLDLELRLENHPGELRVMGTGHFTVPSEDIAQTSVLVLIDSSALRSPKTKLKIGVYSHGERLETVNTYFIGPRS